MSAPTDPGPQAAGPDDGRRAAETVSVAVALLDPDLPVPSYAHPGDAGADLVAREDALLAPAGGRATVATGVCLALPDGFVGLVHPRSGLAARHGVTVLNGPGTVDAGYRGEVAVTLLNTDPQEAFVVRRGDRIAQLVVQRVERARFVVVPQEALPGSVRGVGGHGSTGGFGVAAGPAADVRPEHVGGRI